MGSIRLERPATISSTLCLVKVSSLAQHVIDRARLFADSTHLNYHAMGNIFALSIATVRLVPVEYLLLNLFSGRRID